MAMENNKTKNCPHCGKEILAVAKKCKYCKEWVEPNQTICNTNKADVSLSESQSEQMFIDQVDEPDANNKKKLIFLSVIGIVAIGLILLGVKSCNDERRADAERHAKDVAEYDKWFAEHSCAGIDYRDYSDFANYVQAVFDKKGETTFSGYEDEKNITVTFFGRSDKVRIVEGDKTYDLHYNPSKYRINISNPETYSKSKLATFEILFPYDDTSKTLDPDNENASLRRIMYVSRTGDDSVITELYLQNN